MRDATAVVVNFNSGDRLGRLLDSLEGEVGTVVVVDNASSDGSLDAAEGRTSVEALRNDTNAGFAAAANRGAVGARGTWIVFVNPDAHPLPGQVDALIENVPPDVAVIAPLQMNANGRPLAETGGYDPSLPRFLLWSVIPTRFHGRRGPWIAPPFPRGDVELDWVSGAMMAVRREVFERLGGFDERFFLYQEDVDLGRRARAAGYRVVCRASVRVEHEVAQGDPVRRSEEAQRFVESLGLQFHGWRRRVLGIALLVGFGLRSITGSPGGRAAAGAGLSPGLSLIRRAPARRA